MTLEEFVRREVEKRGGDPEKALLYHREYWERRFKRHLAKLSIAQRSPSEVLEWIYRTLTAAEGDAIADDIDDIKDVIALHMQLHREVEA